MLKVHKMIFKNVYFPDFRGGMGDVTGLSIFLVDLREIAVHEYWRNNRYRYSKTRLQWTRLQWKVGYSEALNFSSPGTYFIVKLHGYNEIK